MNTCITKKIEDILDEAQQNFVIPLMNIQHPKKKKEKATKRHKNFLKRSRNIETPFEVASKLRKNFNSDR